MTPHEAIQRLKIVKHFMAGKQDEAVVDMAIEALTDRMWDYKRDDPTLDNPMGVSQWREHGKIYGYDEYFLASYKERLKEAVGKEKFGLDGDLLSLIDVLKLIDTV